MDMAGLAAALEIVDDRLTLAAGTLPGSGLDALLAAHNGNAPLVLSDAARQVAADVVTVTGTTPFLNVPALPVEAVFTLDSAGTPVARLRFALIGAERGATPWVFSQSFPDLPPFVDAAQNVAQPTLALLDQLSLTQAAFVLTTRAGTDTGGAPLSAGLNFVGLLDPTGALGLFDAIAGAPAQVTLYGTLTAATQSPVTPPLHPETYPWEQASPPPGILLQAALGVSLTVSRLQLAGTALRIYSPPSIAWAQQNPTYETTTALTGTLAVPSAGLSVDLTAAFLRNGANALLAGRFSGFSLSSLAQLADLAAGSDLFAALPTQLQALGEGLGGLQLEAVGVGFSGGVAAEDVDFVSLRVGMPNASWDALPGAFTLTAPYADFIVVSPFAAGRSVNVLLGGTLGVLDVPFDVSAEVPGFELRASLPDAQTVSLQALFQRYLPSLLDGLDASVQGLVVDDMTLMVQPGTGYLFEARTADDPAWTLAVGPVPLEIGSVQVEVDATSPAGTQATFAGAAQIGAVLAFTARYDLPGGFFVRADLPEVKLSSLIATLSEIGLSLPAGFDVDLDQSSLVIERRDGGLRLSVATLVEGLGLVAFTAAKPQGAPGWGFAAGIQLDGASVSSVPGLAALSAFEKAVGLRDLMVVVSSLDDPRFAFPDMASFQAPALAGRSLPLPAQAQGLAKGLNVYAVLDTAADPAFRALAQWLGIKLDGTVGITLAVGLPDPAQASKLFVAIQEQVSSGMRLDGQLGLLVQGGEAGGFLSGKLTTQLGGSTVVFDVAALALANGVLVSGTAEAAQGTQAPVVQIGPVQLSDLALVVGLDLEGVPSVGVAATLDVGNFESSLAVFLDSTDPAKSLVAGSVSGVSLLDVATAIAGQSSIPSVLQGALKRIGLKALSAFAVPGADADALAKALDGRDLATIAGAFQTHGSVALPTQSDRVLLVVNTPGSAWHLTSMGAGATGEVTHYALARQADGSIAVALDPQFYLALQATAIGALTFPQGFEVEAEVDDVILEAQVAVQASAGRGISADVDVAPIVVYKPDFFSVTDAAGAKGPRLSLSTYATADPDPKLQGPHFFLSGKLRMLGVDLLDVEVQVNDQGLAFTLDEQAGPLQVGVSGAFASLDLFNASGSLGVGIDEQLDLGELGSIHVETDVEGQLSLALKAGVASATFQGGFDFEGIHGDLPPVTLDVDGQALANIADTLWSDVSDVVRKALTDADRWLGWVKSGIVAGAGETAQAVGKVLNDVYHLAPDEIASAAQATMGYGADGVAAVLQGAGVAANEAAQVLSGMGYAADEVASALQSAFSGIHADVSLGHLDTPAGPHGDVGGGHGDVAGAHIDKDTFLGHVDETVTPHVDTSTPHVDADVPPHVDTGTHVDT